jgi:hypothetical protein
MTFKKSKEAEIKKWTAAVLDNLAACGPLGAETAAYLRSKQTKIGFSRQKHSAARWTLCGRIMFAAPQYSPLTPPNDPFVLCTLVHEVCHLRQGWLTALSVYGELAAWQTGFRFYYALTKRLPNEHLAELLSLPLTYERPVLHRARTLMQVYAGKGYRIDLLPLFPLHHEIAWRMGLHVSPPVS